MPRTVGLETFNPVSTASVQVTIYIRITPLRYYVVLEMESTRVPQQRAFYGPIAGINTRLDFKIPLINIDLL